MEDLEPKLIRELAVDRARALSVLEEKGITYLDADILDQMTDSQIFPQIMLVIKEDNMMSVEEFFSAYLGPEDVEILRDKWEMYI